MYGYLSIAPQRRRGGDILCAVTDSDSAAQPSLAIAPVESYQEALMSSVLALCRRPLEGWPIDTPVSPQTPRMRPVVRLGVGAARPRRRRD